MRKDLVREKGVKGAKGGVPTLYKIYNSILTILVNTGSYAEIDGLDRFDSSNVDLP